MERWRARFKFRIRTFGPRMSGAQAKVEGKLVWVALENERKKKKEKKPPTLPTLPVTILWSSRGQIQGARAGSLVSSKG